MGINVTFFGLSLSEFDETEEGRERDRDIILLGFTPYVQVPGGQSAA